MSNRRNPDRSSDDTRGWPISHPRKRRMEPETVLTALYITACLAACLVCWLYFGR
jgi:hypothetical protein